MTIKQVEALEALVADGMNCADAFKTLNEALAALRAEAWHPIEDAERLGAKVRDSFIMLGFKKSRAVFIATWNPKAGWWEDRATGHSITKPTHFRFITTPEAQ